MTEELFERPWIEKYRPELLDDVVGTGKTTSVMAIARELLADNFKRATLELNASDDRGIDTVRDKIKSFAAQKINLPEGKHKIIILDEADSMTESAQQALRIIISDYSNTTRFALACNDSNKIIEPLQSRCVILRFSKLKEDEIRERIRYVITKENLEYEENGIDALIDTSEGDMRFALNNLQSTFVGFSKINKDNVYKIVDIPRPEILTRVLDSCFSEDLEEALNGIDILSSEGYTSFDIINVLSKLVQDKDMDELLRLKLLKEISMAKVKALEGYDSIAQLYGLVSSLCQCCGTKK